MEITAEELSNFGLKPRVLQPIHIAALKKLTKDFLERDSVATF